MTLPQDLHLEEQGTMLLCPCLALTLYLDITNNPAIMDFYSQVVQALRAELKYVLVETAARPVPITPKALTTVPTWLKSPRPYKNYFIEFGEVQYGCGEARLQMVYSSQTQAEFTPEKLERRRSNWRILYQRDPAIGGLPVSSLTVTFPLAHALANPSSLLSWIKQLQLVDVGPIVSGWCGLALNDYGVTGNSSDLYRLQQRLAALVLQHPGLFWHNIAGSDVLRFNPQIDDFLPLITRVNWLTFVHTKSVQYLGGLQTLKSRFATNPAIILHELPWGIIIQAGPEPQLGDIGHRDFIPLYREVAKVLRPIRINKIDGMGRGFSAEAANEWLNAFDHEY